MWLNDTILYKSYKIHLAFKYSSKSDTPEDHDEASVL